MTIPRRASKRDTAEGPILRALDAVGALYEQCESFDLLVYHGGQLRMVEVKSEGGKLTQRQEKLLRDGWPLEVWRTPEDALRALEASEEDRIEALREMGVL